MPLKLSEQEELDALVAEARANDGELESGKADRFNELRELKLGPTIEPAPPTAPESSITGTIASSVLGEKVPEYKPWVPQETDPTIIGGMIPNALSDVRQMIRETTPRAIGEGALSLVNAFTPQTKESEALGGAMIGGAKQFITHPIDTAESVMRLLGKTSHERPVSTILNILGGRDILRKGGLIAPAMKKIATSPTSESAIARQAGREGGAAEEALSSAMGNFRKPTLDATALMGKLNEATMKASQVVVDEYANRLMRGVRGGVSGPVEGELVIIREALKNGVDPNDLWKSIEGMATSSREVWLSYLQRGADVSNILQRTGEIGSEGISALKKSHMERLSDAIHQEVLASQSPDKKLNTIAMAMNPKEVTIEQVLDDLKAGVEAHHKRYQTTHQEKLARVQEVENQIASGLLPPDVIDIPPEWSNVKKRWESLLKSNGIEISTGKGSAKDVDTDALSRIIQGARKGRKGVPGVADVPAQEISSKHMAERSLTFGKGSYIQLSPNQQNAIRDVDQLISSLPGEGRASVLDLDALKKSVNNKLFDVITKPWNEYGIPADKKVHLENILENLYGIVREEAGKGLAGKEYNELMKSDEVMIKFRNQLAKLYSLKSGSEEAIYNKMKSIIPKEGLPDYPERKALLAELEQMTQQPMGMKLEALNLRGKFKELFGTSENVAESIHTKKYDKKVLDQLDDLARNVLPESQYKALIKEYEGPEKLLQQLMKFSDQGVSGVSGSPINKLYNLVVRPTQNGVVSVFQEQVNRLFPELKGKLEMVQEADRLGKEMQGIKQGFSTPGPYSPGQIESMAKKYLPEDLLGAVREQTAILDRQERFKTIIGKTSKFDSDDVKLVKELAREVLPENQYGELDRRMLLKESLLDEFRSFSKTGWKKGLTKDDHAILKNLFEKLMNPTKDPDYIATRELIENQVPFLKETTAGRLLNPLIGEKYLAHRVAASAALGLMGAGLYTGMINPGQAAILALLAPYVSPRIKGILNLNIGKAQGMAGSLGGAVSPSALNLGRAMGQFGEDKVLSTTPVSPKEVRSRLVPPR